jgi:hypothetical protein
MTEEMIEETNQLPANNEPEASEVESEEYSEYNAESDIEEQPEGQAVEPEDDSEEIEFNDKSYKLPKDIAEAVKSMRSDYTTKTMSLAEQRKAFEAQSDFHQKHIADVVKVVALNERLAEYDQVDWNALSDSDPVLWQKLTSQRMTLERQRNQLAQDVTRKEQDLHLTRQQEYAKQMEASETVLRREIKDWSPELESKLQDFGVKAFGFDIDDVKKSKADPRLYKLLHMAFLGDQIIKKQAIKSSPTQAKPVPTILGKKSAIAKSIFEVDDQDAFEKMRRRQIAKRK